VLTAEGAPENGSYNWYDSATATEPIAGENGASFITPVLELSRSFFVTAVNNLGCESLVREEVRATVEPVYLVDEVDSEVRCPGQSVTLTASGAPVDGSYKWYNAAGTLIEGETGATLVTAELEESTEYFVSVVNSAFCESEQVSITAMISSEALSVEADNVFICGEGSVTLTASGAPEGGSYQWYDASLIQLEGETSAELTRNASESTLYSVRVISSSKCTSDLLEVSVEVGVVPEQRIIIQEEDILRSNIAGPEYTYEWIFNEEIIPGENGSVYLHNYNAGNYQVRITKEGCPNTSDVYQVQEPLAISDELNTGELYLYPNPADEQIRLEFEGVESAKVSIYVIDISGKIIRSDVMNNMSGRVTWELDIKEYENGVYFVKLADGKKVLTGRFVKK
jgi:hypothetical protein